MSTIKPLYQTIMEYYMNEILTGIIKIEDQIPTELEISKRFNVSRITATRAVKELEQLGLVFRSKGRGTFVNKRSAWKELAVFGAVENKSNSKLRILSLVMPYEKPFGYDILRGVEKKSKEHGYYVTFHCTSYDSTKEKEIVNKLWSDGVHGMIIYPVSSYGNIDVFGDMMINRFPFVLIDRHIEGIEAPQVGCNHDQGTYDITTHLIELGHRKIAFVITDIMEAVSIKDRYRGYCRALIDAGISIRQDWIVDLTKEQSIIPANNPHNDIDVARIVLNRFNSLKQGPTAIVALNDIVAMNLLKVALQMGIQVPGQLSITGFDNLSFCEHLEVPLTTVEQPFFSIGEQAAMMLIDNIRETIVTKKQLVLDTKLVIRQSTAQP